MENKIFVFGYLFDDYNFPFDNSKDKCEKIIKTLEKDIRIVSSCKNPNSGTTIISYLGNDIYNHRLIKEGDDKDIEEEKAYKEVYECIKEYVYFKNIVKLIEDVVNKNFNYENIRYYKTERTFDFKSVCFTHIPLYDYINIGFEKFDDSGFCISYSYCCDQLHCSPFRYEINFPNNVDDLKQYVENKLDEIIYKNYFIHFIP